MDGCPNEASGLGDCGTVRGIFDRLLPWLVWVKAHIAPIFGDVKNQNLGELLAIDDPSNSIPNGFNIRKSFLPWAGSAMGTGWANNFDFGESLRGPCQLK